MNRFSTQPMIVLPGRQSILLLKNEEHNRVDITYNPNDAWDHRLSEAKLHAVLGNHIIGKEKDDAGQKIIATSFKNVRHLAEHLANHGVLYGRAHNV